MRPRDAGSVARDAMSAVEQGAREDWIRMFATDASLEDPVDGTAGRVGVAAITNFWDTSIAMFETVQFDIQKVHEAPGEALVIANVTVRTESGASAHYEAAVHYRLNDADAIAAIRAFWDLPAVLAQLAGD